MAISDQNVILKFILDKEAIQADITDVARAIGKLENVAEGAGKALSDAVKTEAVEKMKRIIELSSKELEGMEANLEEIEKGVEEAFNVLTPTQFAKALGRINEILEELEEQNKKNRRSFADFVRSALRGARRVANSITRGFGKAFSAIGSFASKTLGAIGRLGGLVGVLGLADLIAGWSIFSKQFQATLKDVDGFEKVGGRLTLTFRRIAELLGRVIGPIVVEIAEAFADWLDALDVGLIQKSFRAIGIVLTNLANTVGSLFGSGSGSVTEGLINFGITILAVLNGIIGALGSFKRTAKAVLLDVVSFLANVASNLAPFSIELRALSASLDVLADDARENMGSITGDFQKFFNQIKDIQKEDIKWKDITPIPTEEEAKADEARLKAQRDLLLEWLGVLNSLEEEVKSFRSPFELAIDSIGELRRQVEKLRGEAKQLEQEGIISESQLRSSLALIDEWSDEVVGQIRATLKTFELEEIDDPLSKRQEELTKIRDDFVKQQQQERAEAERLKKVEEGRRSEVAKLSEERIKAETAEKRAGIERIKQLEELARKADVVAGDIAIIGDAATVALEVQRGAIDQQIANLDRLARAQEGRVARAIQVAEDGNAELVEAEEKRLEQINQAREEAARREREIAAVQIAIAQAVALAQGISAVIKGFQQGGLVGGIIQSVALLGTVAGAIITLRNAFSNLPAFFYGDPFIDGPGGRDNIVARVSKGERVVSAAHNDQLGGRSLSNEELVTRAKLGSLIYDNKLGAALPTLAGSGIGPLASSLLSMQKSQEERLDSLALELGALVHEVKTLSVNFEVTDRGLAAAVQSANSRREFRNKLKR